MNALAPGDWVECIKGRRYMGSIWQVVAVWEGDGEGCDHDDDCDGSGLELKDFPDPGEYGLCTCGFRPIYRPRADFIESLKAPREKIDA